MDYSRPKYQDVWAFALFYIHVVIMIGVAVLTWSSIDTSSDSDSDTDTTFDSDTDSAFWDAEDFNLTGVICALIASVVAGSFFGLCWLQCIKMYPEVIIKVMLFVSVACWALVAIVGLTVENGGGMVFIGLVFALITALYAWWYVISPY